MNFSLKSRPPNNGRNTTIKENWLRKTMDEALKASFGQMRITGRYSGGAWPQFAISATRSVPVTPPAKPVTPTPPPSHVEYGVLRIWNSNHALDDGFEIYFNEALLGSYSGAPDADVSFSNVPFNVGGSNVVFMKNVKANENGNLGSVSASIPGRPVVTVSYGPPDGGNATISIDIPV